METRNSPRKSTKETSHILSPRKLSLRMHDVDPEQTTRSTEITPKKSSSSKKTTDLREFSMKNSPKSTAPCTPPQNHITAHMSTPASRRKTKPLEEAKSPGTPYNLRRRIHHKLQKMLSLSDDSDSESDYKPSDSESESSDSSSEKESEEVSYTALLTPKSTTKKRRGELKPEATSVEDYFAAQSSQGSTSSHTLNRLKTPRMPQSQVRTVMSKLQNDHQSQREELHLECIESYHKWMLLLKEGFNLVLYGLGSKRFILDGFRDRMLSEFDCIVVNGYFPTLSFKHVLNSVTEEMFSSSASFSSLQDQTVFIKDQLDLKRTDPFVLLVHNIDGPGLQDEKVQGCLAVLAEHPKVHLVASIDHVNAPLVWDQVKLGKFRFMWLDATTFDPYLEETAFESSLLLQQSNTLALSSLTHVFQSLTPNSQKIFLQIVQYQLENRVDANFIGIAFPELYQQCREAFLVNSDLTLRAQLTEFRDHHLIKTKKSHDGVEHLLVPLETATLEEFLQQSDV